MKYKDNQESLNKVINLLDSYELQNAPNNFTKSVMKRINEKEEKVLQINQRNVITVFSKSLIAAGVFISFINVSSFSYKINSMVMNVNKYKIDFEKIHEIFNNIFNYLG